MQTQVAGVPGDRETFHVWRGEMQGESGYTTGAEGSRLCELQGLRAHAARQGKGYIHTGGVADGAPLGSTTLELPSRKDSSFTGPQTLPAESL